MILISGRVGESEIYERLLQKEGTVGFVLDDLFINHYISRQQYFVARSVSPEDLRDFIKKGLLETPREVILYSDYNQVEIQPYIEVLREIEKVASIIIMFKEMA